jgi:hypothetical protein
MFQSEGANGVLVGNLDAHEQDAYNCRISTSVNPVPFPGATGCGAGFAAAAVTAGFAAGVVAAACLGYTGFPRRYFGCADTVPKSRHANAVSCRIDGILKLYVMFL